MSDIGWQADIAQCVCLSHLVGMASYYWSQPERRDLYLAARILAGREEDGDWRQWASDTLIQDLELYDDPRQGAAAWLAPNEEELADLLGQRLWGLVGADPLNAATLLDEADPALTMAASKLVGRMESNGRANARMCANGWK